MLRIDYDGLLRNWDQFNITYVGPVPRTECFNQSYFLRVAKLWNVLPVNIKSIDVSENFHNKCSCFKKHVKKFLMDILDACFDTQNICTWSMACRCNRCRIT